VESTSPYWSRKSFRKRDTVKTRRFYFSCGKKAASKVREKQRPSARRLPFQVKKGGDPSAEGTGTGSTRKTHSDHGKRGKSGGGKNRVEKGGSRSLHVFGRAHTPGRQKNHGRGKLQNL